MRLKSEFASESSLRKFMTLYKNRESKRRNLTVKCTNEATRKMTETETINDR
jgi:hypothetical protein